MRYPRSNSQYYAGYMTIMKQVCDVDIPGSISQNGNVCETERTAENANATVVVVAQSGTGSLFSTHHRSTLQQGGIEFIQQ